MAAKTISKTLSSNDTGETGGHQAGILVPKEPEILSFFPKLDKSHKNPRANLLFVDAEDYEWNFVFIYYNNKFFGGTRNEYRLTGMTRYIRENNLKQGDEMVMSVDDEGKRSIACKRKDTVADGPLVLKGTWKVIKL
jgi:hypothetical protein